MVPLALLGLVTWMGANDYCLTGACDPIFSSGAPGASPFLQAVAKSPADSLKVSKGTAAPDWALSDATGRDQSLAAHDGKVVVLNFWAKFCPPCMAEIPSFNSVAEDYAEADVAVLGVAIDFDDDASLRAFAEKKGIDFAVACAKPELLELFTSGALMVPTTIVIDREGVVSQVLVGYQEEQVLRQAVENVL
ncbi:MAG: peroxiredoxin family protein [Opitutales bacterium]